MIDYNTLHYNINSSLLKMCYDFINDNSLTDFDSFDFDAHAVIDDLPNRGLIGIGEYSLTEDQDLFRGSCMVMISTKPDDKNIKILKPIISKMFARLRTGQYISLVDSTSGLPLGTLKITTGTDVLPVARTRSRPLQVIGINFVVTLNP